MFLCLLCVKHNSTQNRPLYPRLVEDYHTYYVANIGTLVHNECKQKMVAGNKDGYNAKVSVGGETRHPHSPHAHIYQKYTKIASVNAKGEILAGSLDKRGRAFVKDNLSQIAEGIKQWWFYEE